MNTNTARAAVNDQPRQDSILARLMAQAATAEADVADDLTAICRTIIDIDQVPAARIFPHLIDLAAAGYREAPALGEPRCYYSDLRHLRDDYPNWQVTESWKDLARRVVETRKLAS